MAGSAPGQVVVYDPERDLAVIYVPGLAGPVLPFEPRTERPAAPTRSCSGYPLDGPYDAQSARIRDAGPIRGPDIYDSSTVTREIYTIRGAGAQRQLRWPAARPARARYSG